MGVYTIKSVISITFINHLVCCMCLLVVLYIFSVDLIKEVGLKYKAFSPLM